ncbi:MAG: amidohydrolase [Planctomycetes bacterium]|nr:amidohydrolase [Planctomycetota bacterium]
MITKVLASFLILLVSLPALRAQKADLIILGARIETMDLRYREVEALAVSRGRILALGGTAAIRALAAEDTRIVEAEGAFLMPGLIESHAHLAGLGQSLRSLDLKGLASYEELVARVAAAAAGRPKGAWIVGRGWDQNLWPVKEFPDHAALSAAVPDHPVLLTRVDGHALLANARAMALAGIDATTPDPEGGEIIRRSDGSPSGVFVDRAEDLIQARAPRVDPADLEASFLAAQEACFAQGITSFHDAGIATGSAFVLGRLMTTGRFKLRVYAMASVPDLETAKIMIEEPPLIGGFDQRLTLRAWKIYADGALGSRGAAMLDDYSDRPGHRGLLITQAETLRAISELAIDHGYQACVHAIGDRANRMVLDVWTDLFAAHPDRLDLRFRIEHAQIIHHDDLPRFARLGVIAAMQGVHCSSDMAWVPRRIAARRAELGAYAWRSLLDTGAVVCNGTDAPVESISPFECLHASVTRQDKEGQPPEGFFPAQRMTRMEALASYTLAGAYAAFEENLKGRLAPGLLADFILVDRDLRTCSDRELLGARVLRTFVGGEEVHRLKDR